MPTLITYNSTTGEIQSVLQFQKPDGGHGSGMLEVVAGGGQSVLEVRPESDIARLKTAEIFQRYRVDVAAKRLVSR